MTGFDPSPEPWPEFLVNRLPFHVRTDDAIHGVLPRQTRSNAETSRTTITTRVTAYAESLKSKSVFHHRHCLLSIVLILLLLHSSASLFVANGSVRHPTQRTKDQLTARSKKDCKLLARYSPSPGGQVDSSRGLVGGCGVTSAVLAPALPGNAAELCSPMLISAGGNNQP